GKRAASRRENREKFHRKFAGIRQADEDHRARRRTSTNLFRPQRNALVQLLPCHRLARITERNRVAAIARVLRERFKQPHAPPPFCSAAVARASKNVSAAGPSG